jgi:hypothetical protein
MGTGDARRLFGGVCAARPAPMVVAASGLSDPKLRQYVDAQHQSTLLVEGNQSYTFILADGQTVKGRACIQGEGAAGAPVPVGARSLLRATAGSPFDV